MTDQRELIQWDRRPSVTTGGKQYYYLAYIAGPTYPDIDGTTYSTREPIGSVCWHRGVKAYEVEYCGQPCGSVATVAAGRGIIRRLHHGGGR